VSRAPALTVDDAPAVRQVREAYPHAALPELARLVGEQLGVHVSKSALHRFMQAHDIERQAVPWPSDEDLAEFARKAKAVARAQPVPLCWRRHRTRGQARRRYLEDVRDVFSALLVLHGERAGVPGLKALAQRCRAWLAEMESVARWPGSSQGGTA
jgi:hypothetical protein